MLAGKRWGGGKWRHSPRLVRAAHPGARAEVPGVDFVMDTVQKAVGKGEKDIAGERNLAFTEGKQ